MRLFNSLRKYNYCQLICRNGALNFMWGMLESLRKLTSLTIISIRLPPLTTIINRSLLQFSQVDILPTDKIEEYFIEFDDEGDSPLSQSFESAGFGSRNALRNLGSTFLYINLSFFYYSLIFALNLFVYAKGKLRNAMSKMTKNLFWPYPLRMIIQQYFFYTLASLINLTQLSDKSSGEQLASIVSIALLVIVLGAPPLFTILLMNRHKITQFEERFVTLTEGMTEDGAYSVVIELMQAMFTILIQIYLRETPAIQLTFIYFLSLLKQIYLVKMMRFLSFKDHSITLINELIISIYLLMFMFFTDANENTHIHHACDIILVAIAGVFALINIGSCFVSSAGPLLTKLKTILYTKFQQRAKIQTYKDKETEQTILEESRYEKALKEVTVPQDISEINSIADSLENRIKITLIKQKPKQTQSDLKFDQLFEETSGSLPFKTHHHNIQINSNMFKQEIGKTELKQEVRKDNFWVKQNAMSKGIDKSLHYCQTIDEEPEIFYSKSKIPTSKQKAFHVKLNTVNHTIGLTNKQKQETNWIGTIQNKQIYMLRQKPINNIQQSQIYQYPSKTYEEDIWEQ
ncbi:hypothetical protein FGO68_gene16327 [Halteria grandinella]|uniref:TRP C-terminal domain-containing protein n=1 Tax=Halteria grandinella TaxID=5974 RepID=A0A8J8P6Y6_HALGN|nr:hypothetical protein FGO68_gene16327 [Halteria grandinella]